MSKLVENIRKRGRMYRVLFWALERSIFRPGYPVPSPFWKDRHNPDESYKIDQVLSIHDSHDYVKLDEDVKFVSSKRIPLETPWYELTNSYGEWYKTMEHYNSTVFYGGKEHYVYIPEGCELFNFCEINGKGVPIVKLSNQ